MKFISLILNLPWTLLGVLFSIISIPREISLKRKSAALIFKVSRLWWLSFIPHYKHARAMALGNIVILGPKEMPRDLEHELVHIKQWQREPLIHIFLYSIESMRHGYRNNKYEQEAYEKARNFYHET